MSKPTTIRVGHLPRPLDDAWLFCDPMTVAGPVQPREREPWQVPACRRGLTARRPHRRLAMAGICVFAGILLGAASTRLVDASRPVAVVAAACPRASSTPGTATAERSESGSADHAGALARPPKLLIRG